MRRRLNVSGRDVAHNSGTQPFHRRLLLYALEGCDVRKILRPAGSSFVRDEVLFRENESRYFPVLRGDAILPRCIEVETVDGSDDVDPHRFDSDLKCDAR